MPFHPHKPLLYLITRGATSEQTTPSTDDFSQILKLAQAAVAAKIDLLQIREKKLSTRVLCELARLVAGITRGTATRLLINDRADVAAASGADGVHLTAKSLPAKEVRRAFGPELIIGVSTHSPAEAFAARDSGADFVVFGPVFETDSKRIYGEPLGLGLLQDVAVKLEGFPVIALGGVDLSTVYDCARVGAHGVAAIRMFDDPQRLVEIANEVRLKFHEGLPG